MRKATLTVSAVAIAALVAVSAWLFRWPLEKAALLAPIIVVTAGATAFLFVLWIKIALESLRRSRHPLAIVAAVLGSFAVLVAVSAVVAH